MRTGPTLPEALNAPYPFKFRPNVKYGRHVMYTAWLLDYILMAM